MLDKNEALLPFLGDKMSFVTGLDPLGLQNSSTQMYSFLLPGLNNVTAHIRNYSFYCWLLNAYSKQIETLDPKKQKRFLRKAEYLLALIAYQVNEGGISGTQFAKKQFEAGKETFKLNEGIYNSDGGTVGTYWQYQFGVFGQYYVGAMKQMGLIDEPIDKNGKELGLYRRTESTNTNHVCGLSLAKAFDAGLSEKGKKLFFECHSSEIANKEQLETLSKDFLLTSIDTNNEEAKLLLQMLTDKDTPFSDEDIETDMRNQTLLRLLTFASTSTKVTDRQFTFDAYNKSSQSIENNDNALIGWYFYQFNEYWQFACTAIFNATIQYLRDKEGPNWMETNTLIEQIKDLILEELSNQAIELTTVQEIKVESNETELYKQALKGNYKTRLTNSFLLIFKLYHTNKNNIDFLNQFTRERGVNGENDVLQFFLYQFPKEPMNIENFLYDFLRNNIINRHRYVAYRKMGTGNQSTQKFIIEGEHIRQIDNFSPSFTGPRIGNLIQFMSVLGLLDEKWNISNKGEAYLTKAS